MLVTEGGRQELGLVGSIVGTLMSPFFGFSDFLMLEQSSLLLMGRVT